MLFPVLFQFNSLVSDPVYICSSFETKQLFKVLISFELC